MTNFGEKVIDESGVRLGDQVKLKAFGDRSRVLKLGRTRVVIEKSDEEEQCFGPLRWPLSGPMQRDQFELVLDSNVSDGRFILNAMGESFFIHNGTPTWRCYIKRGDCVDIGYNRLEFLVPDQASSQAISIPSHIVKSKLNILLIGETGTGKSRMARLIHEESGQRGKFVHLNLSAIPESLIASELFGHLKGSFTGAIGNKIGAVEEANNGTLFLDEVDSLSLDLQVKLLLFLDNKKYRPLGANFEKTSSPRIVFAAGRDLSRLVENGEMRRDFYFRLSSGFNHKIDPLRKNRKEISRFLKEWATSKNVTLARDLEDFILSKKWPGNYRELLGFLERKLTSSQSNYLTVAVEDEDNVEIIQADDSTEANVLTLAEVKSNYARRIYRSLGGNLKLTARTLAISPNTLRKFLSDSGEVVAA